MMFKGGQRDALTTARLKENMNATRAHPQQPPFMPRGRHGGRLAR
jgi:hypothetical protein